MEKKQDGAEKSQPGPVVRDAAIEKRADDRLGRAPFADAIAQHIVEGNVSDGAVVAVMGPWGSGKTSVLNMVREALSDRPDDRVLVVGAELFPQCLLDAMAVECEEIQGVRQIGDETRVGIVGVPQRHGRARADATGRRGTSSSRVSALALVPPLVA